MQVADRAFGALPLGPPSLSFAFPTMKTWYNIVHFRLVRRDVCDVAFLSYSFSRLRRTPNRLFSRMTGGSDCRLGCKRSTWREQLIGFLPSPPLLRLPLANITTTVL